jgi:hypothetical protein
MVTFIQSGIPQNSAACCPGRAFLASLKRRRVFWTGLGGVPTYRSEFSMTGVEVQKGFARRMRWVLLGIHCSQSDIRPT